MIQTINGRYTLHDPLGKGGMGIVHRATDRLTGNTVALKQVFLPVKALFFASRPVSDGTRKLRLALAHEFQTLASMRHPNIISVLDYGFDEAGQPFFTMDYLEDAQTILAAAGSCSVSEKIELLIQNLEALAYLHRRGILHRDIKPENVLVVENQVRVLDFGLAVSKEQATESVGSWFYMAPEIWLGEPATEASDLYSLGVLAYQMLAGVHPFDIYAPDLIDEILEGEPNWGKMGVGEELTAVIRLLLAKKPTERYQSANEAIQAFNAAWGQLPPSETAAIRESYLQAAKFVGREAEITQLMGALALAEQGKGSAWLIGGESGVGKSRLLNELRIRALVQGVLVFSGNVAPDGVGVAYQLWRDIMRQLVVTLHVADETAAVLRPLIPDVGQLLQRSLPKLPVLEGQAAQRRLHQAILSLFQQQKRPLLLLLEDLQWINESIVVLQLLAAAAGKLPLVIIASYRSDERPKLPEELPSMQLVTLGRLAAPEMVALSQAMLGTEGLTDDMLRLLQQETEGNTFFLVEIVRFLAEEAGRLDAIGTRQLPQQLFPQGIQALVQRRLGQVPAWARKLLTAAAVAGRQIDVRLLRQFAPPFDIESWLHACAAVAVLEVMHGEWQFAHDKLREGVLWSLVATERQDLHRQVAEALEDVYPDDPVQAAVLAYHWQQAGAEAKERDYAEAAGVYAEQQYANEEALRFYERAIALLPAAKATKKFELLVVQHKLLHILGRHDAQKAVLSMLEETADFILKHSDIDRRAEVALRRADYADAVSDYEMMAVAAQEAIELAQRPTVVAEAKLFWGQALLFQGKHDSARERLQEAIVLLPAETASWQLAKSYRLLGVIAIQQGLLPEAVRHLQQAEALYRQLDHLQGIGSVANNLGGIAYAEGNYLQAKAYWEEVRRIYRQIGDREGVARALINLALVYRRLGVLERTWAYSEEVLAMCRELGIRLGEYFALMTQGIVCYYREEWEKAISYYQNALRLIQPLNVPLYEANVFYYLRQTKREQDDLEIARTHYEQAKIIYEQVGRQPLVTHMELCLTEIANRQGHIGIGQAEYTAIFARVEKNVPLSGFDEPFQMIVTAIKLGQLLSDPTVEQLINKAQALLQTQADKITDEALQQSFLNDVPEHRWLSDAFAASSLP